MFPAHSQPTDERPDVTTDLSRLSLNTVTTKALTLQEAVDAAVRAGLPAVGLWRDRVAEAGLEESARIVREAGLRVSSLCRGGFLTAADADGQRAALEDNRAAIREAATLGTRELIMVVGGLPAASDRKSTRLNSSHVAISYAVFCLNKKTSRRTPGA